MAEDERIYLGSKDQVTEIGDADSFIIVTSDGIRKMTKAQVMEKLGINQLTKELEEDISQLSEKMEEFDNTVSELKDTIANKSGGMSDTTSALLVTILRNGVYSTDQSANITALEAALASSGSDDTGTETVTYTVTNKLTNVTNGNSTASVNENATYTATLTAADGYELDTVTVTMDGVDVTSTVYADGKITIAAVTGDVVITASAAEETPAVVYEMGSRNYTMPSVSAWTDESGATIDKPSASNGIYFLSNDTFENDTDLAIEFNYSSTYTHLIYIGSYYMGTVSNTKIIDIKTYPVGTIFTINYTVNAGCQLIIGFGNAVNPKITVTGV